MSYLSNRPSYVFFPLKIACSTNTSILTTTIGPYRAQSINHLCRFWASLLIRGPCSFNDRKGPPTHIQQLVFRPKMVSRQQLFSGSFHNCTFFLVARTLRFLLTFSKSFLCLKKGPVKFFSCLCNCNQMHGAKT